MNYTKQQDLGHCAEYRVSSLVSTLTLSVPLKLFLKGLIANMVGTYSKSQKYLAIILKYRDNLSPYAGTVKTTDFAMCMYKIYILHAF